ncbi:MAG: peptidase [Deltaproteobacteria bacterium]|nr:peptidase [Deltaproteobacteria bacterium]
MSLMSEYIKKIEKEGWTVSRFEEELVNLIKKYNQIRNSYLLIYATAGDKPIDQKMIMQDDYYIIHDLLKDRPENNLDVFIETLGGSGEVVEEIVGFFHGKFDTISFIIAGQAKSAGTIMALSGHEIYMTETGSLGPIDAQVKLGRSRISASDYVDWIEQKKTEAEKTGKLNPFDAIMIAQITPGELYGIVHSLQYAKDLVIDWIPKYKFKNWITTETRKIAVTDEMKKARAKEIADKLIERETWRTHGRPIKINDLQELLKINRIEDDPKLSEVVFKIHTVIRFLFERSTVFKIFAIADEKIFRHFHPPIVQPAPGPGMAPQQADVVVIDHSCNNCGKMHKLYAKLKKEPKIDFDMKAQGRTPLPVNNLITCPCGVKIDLTPVRRDIEANLGKKLVF